MLCWNAVSTKLQHEVLGRALDCRRGLARWLSRRSYDKISRRLSNFQRYIVRHIHVALASCDFAYSYLYGHSILVLWRQTIQNHDHWSFHDGELFHNNDSFIETWVSQLFGTQVPKCFFAIALHFFCHQFVFCSGWRHWRLLHRWIFWPCIYRSSWCSDSQYCVLHVPYGVYRTLADFILDNLFSLGVVHVLNSQSSVSIWGQSAGDVVLRGLRLNARSFYAVGRIPIRGSNVPVAL